MEKLNRRLRDDLNGFDDYCNECFWHGKNDHSALCNMCKKYKEKFENRKWPPLFFTSKIKESD